MCTAELQAMRCTLEKKTVVTPAVRHFSLLRIPPTYGYTPALHIPSVITGVGKIKDGHPRPSHGELMPEFRYSVRHSLDAD